MNKILNKPRSRALIGAASGLAFAVIFKPSVSFNENKRVKPWYYTNKNNPDSTFFPLFAWPVLGAIITGVFI